MGDDDDDDEDEEEDEEEEAGSEVSEDAENLARPAAPLPVRSTAE